MTDPSNLPFLALKNHSYNQLQKCRDTPTNKRPFLLQIAASHRSVRYNTKKMYRPFSQNTVQCLKYFCNWLWCVWLRPLRKQSCLKASVVAPDPIYHTFQSPQFPLCFLQDGNWAYHKPAVRANNSTKLQSKASCCLETGRQGPAQSVRDESGGRD